MTTSEDEKAAIAFLRDYGYWDQNQTEFISLGEWEDRRRDKNIFLAGANFARENPIKVKDGDILELKIGDAKIQAFASDKIPPNEIHLYDPKGALKIVDVYADREKPSKAE